jgi:ubiquinone/menaquinone biosynthesis C-methylase UbiE
MAELDAETLAGMKDRTRAVWNQGTYDFIGRMLEPAAQHLVDACAVSAGQEMLDVAAGDGNVTMVAAREGASVVATDIAAAQVERGRARTEAEGYDVEWLEADAEDLPFEDNRFDAALSCFGAIFAPRPRHTMEEMFRVVKPGGTVGITAWVPEGYSGRLLHMACSFVPSPEGVEPSAEWGKEERIRERLEGLASSIRIEPGRVVMRADSFDHAWEQLSHAAGGLGALRRNAAPEVVAQVREALESLGREFNQSDDGSVAVDNDYVAIVARKPG